MKNKNSRTIGDSVKDLKFLEDYKFNEDYEPTPEEQRLVSYMKSAHFDMNSYRDNIGRSKQYEDADKRLYDRTVSNVATSENDSEEDIRQPIEYAVQMGMSSQIANKPPKVEITGVEESDKVHEDVANEIAQFKIIEEAKFSERLFETLITAKPKGECYMRVLYVETTKKIRLPKEKKETSEEEYQEDNLEDIEYKDYDGVVFEVLSPERVWVNSGALDFHRPGGIGAVDECIAETHYYFPSWREDRQRAGFKNVESVIPSHISSHTLIEEYNKEVFLNNVGKHVVEHTFYSVSLNKVIIVANGVVIYEGALIGNTIPIEAFRNILIPGQFHSRGDVEIIRGLVGMSNGMFNNAAKQAELAINPLITASHGIDIDDIEFGPGNIIPTKSDANNAISFYQVPDITNGVQYMTDYIKGMIINAVGYNYDTLNADPNQTAFGLALQQEQTNIRLKYFLKINEESIKNIVEIAWMYLQKFFPRKKARLIVKPNGDFAVQDKYPEIKVRGKKPKKINHKNGITTVKFDKSKGAMGMFEVEPEYIEGNKFDFRVSTSSMVNDMILVKSQKTQNMLSQLQAIPDGIQSLKPEAKAHVVENSGESAPRWLKDEFLYPSQQDVVKIENMESEYDLLISSDKKVEDIVKQSSDHEKVSEFLTLKVQENYEDEENQYLSIKQITRINKAIQLHEQMQQQAQQENVNEADQQAQLENKSQQQQAVQQSQIQQGMPNLEGDSGVTSQSSIRKQAAQLSGNLTTKN